MASLEINNLGKFADMSAVWSTHPEGGREGDFLTIGQRRYNWDLIERQWKPLDDETAPGGPASETITGDLTVGGDLHVGGDAVIEGDVTVNGELHLPNGERYKGQSIYRSIVFARSNNRPDTPSGGSFANPLPDGNVWKDGIPSGIRPIWMSSRVFTSDDKAPATSSWTVPALMSDAENFDVEFSPAATNTVPPPPMSGSNGNLGWLWFDPVRNPNADWDKMNWMATRTQSQGVWGDWTIVLIKGETGDGVQSVFTVTNGSIPSISGTSYPPSGWYKSVDSLTVNQGDALWMSERRFENGAWSAWGSPVRLNGVDGLPGEDATDIEFIYKRMNRLPNTGGYTDSAPNNQRDQDDYVPTSEGWSDHPSGVDANAKYEWVCQRTKGPNDTQWSEWVGPFVWSAFGERGMDGDGVEYVFIRTTVFTQPTITEAAVQEAEHYPVVANYASYNTGEIDGNTFFDNPKGVGPTWLYEWVSRRKKVNGVWGTFSSPGLWATYSEEHTIDIDPVTGCWIIDGNLTDKKAIGQGVAVKGRVDVYLDTDKTSQSQKSLESYPSSLTGDKALQIGDCWIVETGTGVAGHLFLCVATTGTMSAMWQDLGEFKGEPGQSQYMHIAWASKINFTGSPQQFASAEGFTKDYVAGRSYDWMGVAVDSNDSDANLEAVNYKWNYLKGKDGNDVEYVYLRTKVNTAPTITEAAVQTPERYPAVANYSNYAAGDVEHDTFTDDPNGVNDPWKYEWVSRREKSYNPTTGKMEWGQFLSPARLWSKWADQGEPGENAFYVKPSVVQIVIDTDKDGNVLDSTKRNISFKCWLYDGKDKVVPTTYSAKYGSTTINIGTQAFIEGNPYVTISYQLPAQLTETKDIEVTLGKSGRSASVTVPVVVNRAGTEGRSVFKSIVFMRSYTKPNTPGDNDGNYDSPVPSATHTDSDNSTCTWDDGIETGTKPVWMTSRIFSSDSQSPPQEAHWNPVTLMKDEPNTLDIEFSPAPADGNAPNPPADGRTHGGEYPSQVWFDPDEDGGQNGHFNDYQMNWMATRKKVATANSTSWGNWVINRIRGEKGNDGAGQAYVAAIPDKIVIDCNSESKSKRYVLVTVTVYLMWGDEKCALKSSCNVNYSGGGTVTRSAFQQGDDQLEFEFEVANNAAIQSGLIQVTLVGTDSNSVEHVAALSIPVNVNVQGAKGVKGSVLRFRGAWSDSEYYVYNDTFRDCVKYNGSYYIMSDYTYGLPGMQTQEPDSDTQSWDNIGNMQFVATELLLAENATIQLLNSNRLIFTNVDGDKTAGINEDGEGSFRTYYPDTGNLRKDDNADGWTYYYNNDADNTLAWKLGPDGVIIRENVIATMQPISFSNEKVNIATLNSGTTFTMRTLYIYSNSQSQYHGCIFDSGNLDSSGNPTGNLLNNDGLYSRDIQANLMQEIDQEPQYVLRTISISGNKIAQQRTILNIPEAT